MKCSNCQTEIRAAVDVVDCDECNGMHPARGTLLGDWLIRWVGSHQQPRMFVLEASE
jgi:hypothetical protein